MQLDLRFTSRPLHAIWCEAVVGFVYKDSFLTEGHVAGVDQKTSAYLRYLNKKGFWDGAIGETLLIAGEERLRADKVLFKGLGPRDELKPEELIEQVVAASRLLEAMGVQSFAVKIPLLGNMDRHMGQLEKAVKEMMGPFIQRHMPEEDYLLTALFSVETVMLEVLREMEAKLKAYFEPTIYCTLVVEPSGSGANI